MKKTLLATAILGAMSFAAVAQAAPTVYGNIQLAVDLEKDNTAGDNGSTIGFKGEEALDNGLAAIYKAEFEFPSAGANKSATGGLTAGDQSYLGVKGNFGTVRVGSFDTVSNDFVYDMVVAMESVSGAVTAFTNGTTREAQQVAYTGDFGGVQVGASVQLNGKTAGNSDIDNSMQIGVKLPVDAFTVAAAYDTYKAAMGVAVATSMDALTVAGKFETSDTVETALTASVAYNYGMGSAYALLNTGKNKGGKEESSTSAGISYKLGKPMFVYAEVASGNDLSSTKIKQTKVGATVVF